MNDFDTFTKLPSNVEDLGTLIVALKSYPKSKISPNLVTLVSANTTLQKSQFFGMRQVENARNGAIEKCLILLISNLRLMLKMSNYSLSLVYCIPLTILRWAIPGPFYLHFRFYQQLIVNLFIEIVCQ